MASETPHNPEDPRPDEDLIPFAEPPSPDETPSDDVGSEPAAQTPDEGVGPAAADEDEIPLAPDDTLTDAPDESPDAAEPLDTEPLATADWEPAPEQPASSDEPEPESESPLPLEDEMPSLAETAFDPTPAEPIFAPSESGSPWPPEAPEMPSDDSAAAVDAPPVYPSAPPDPLDLALAGINPLRESETPPPVPPPDVPPGDQLPDDEPPAEAAQFARTERSFLLEPDEIPLADPFPPAAPPPSPPGGARPAGAAAPQMLPLEKGPGIFERYSLWWLLLITLAAAFFRFAWIDHPVLWTDEAYTFRRVTTSFQDLLDVLQYDGFGPLVYEFYWWLAQMLGGATHLTPFWMRLLPASAGTLMVPAMYFLARQLLSKRTSLVVALFTASSAYMMVYSHDAKMYMVLWLAVALNVGALFCWFRTNLRVAWLGWIAAGLIVGSTHATGLIALSLQPLFLLTQRRMHWKKFILFVVGFGVIASGPAVHYLQFNRWTDRIEDMGWGASGLGWVPGVVGQRGGDQMVLSTTSAYMYSWEWPRFTYRDDDPANFNSRNTGHAMGAMLQGFNINPKIMSGLMTAVVLVLILCALGAMPWSRRLRGVRPGVEPRQSPWRITFWLGAWMALPAYAFYCVTMYGMDRSHVEPVYFWNTFTSSLPPQLFQWQTPTFSWWMIYAGMVIAAALICGLSRWLSIGLAVLLAGAGVYYFGYDLWHLTWTRPVGTPGGKASTEFLEAWRLIRLVGDAFFSAITRPWMMWGWMVVFPAVAFRFCGSSMLQRIKRSLSLLVAVAALYGLVCLLYYFVENDLASRSRSEIGAIWMPRYLGTIWPAFALAVCALLMRLPTRILRIVAVCLLLGVNVAQACGRMFAGTEPRMDRMIPELVASQETDAQGHAVHPDFRVYIQPGANTAHPGGAGLYDNSPKYYATIARGKVWFPQEFRGINLRNYLTIWSDTTPSGIAGDVRRNPQLKRISVWDRHPETPENLPERLKLFTRALDSAKLDIDYRVDGRTYSKRNVPELERIVASLKKRIADGPGPDDILAALGPGWKKTEDQWYQVRYHWNWSETFAYHHRAYEHTEPPSTRPVRP